MKRLLLPACTIALFGFFNLFGIKSGLHIYHFVFFLLGLVAYFVVRSIGWQFFRLNARFFYWFFVGLLIITFIIGVNSRGSTRWIDFYFLRFQASEFMKSIFAVFMAAYLSEHVHDIDSPRVFIKGLIYFLIPTFLIFKQPDLANSLVYVCIYLSILFFSKVPKRFILITLIVGALLLPFSWLLLKEYQKARVTSFFNPHIDTQGTAYNMTQAVITVGSGRFMGRGLGLGTQSRLYFLPENSTDFAYSSLVEQFGFVGGLVVVFMYFMIIMALVRKLLGYSTQKDSDTTYMYLYTVGLTSYLGFQIFVNVGMNLGILPVAGVALPFISYGGSAIMSTLIGLALVPS